MSKKINTTQPRACRRCSVTKQPECFSVFKVTICKECIRIQSRAYTEKRTGRKVKPLTKWNGDHKECSMCGKEKHRSEYSQVSRGNGRYEYFAHCTDCHNAGMRSYYARTPKRQESANAYATKQYAENTTGIRSQRLLSEYGVTLEQKHKMVAQNGGKCPICRRPEEKLVVDHCHRTGKVRGIICDHCNKVLGFARDNMGTLTSAAHYLCSTYINHEPGIVVAEGVPKPDEEWELEGEAE